MAHSTIITDYIAYGLYASIPVSPPVGAGVLSLYLATDTGDLYGWTGSSYVLITGSVMSVIAQGGPFLANGTITTAGTIDNSITSLTASALLLGAGTSPVSALASLGSTITVLHGNASGAPSFGAVNLAADVSGRLPFAGIATLAATSLFGNGTTVGATGSNIAIGSGLTLSVAGTLASTAGVGSVTSVVSNAAPFLNAGTITSAGTLTAATLAATSLVGNAAATGSIPAAIAIGTGLSLSVGGTLSNSSPDTNVWNAGTVTTIGLGLAVSAGTITNTAPDTNIWNAGTVTTIGSNVTLTSGTLSASAPGTGTVTQLVAGSNLTGGTITGSGTIALQASPTIAAVVSNGTLNTGPFVINANSIVPVSYTGTLLQLVGDAPGNGPLFEMDGYTGAPAMVWRRAQGTAATPTATHSGQYIGQFLGFGYGATGWSSSGRVVIAFSASEAWTDSAQGTNFIFANTAPGGTVTTSALSISGAQIVGIGTVPATGVKLQVIGGTSTDTLILNSATVYPVLKGTTGSIGGSALLAGQDATGTVAIAGVTTAMAVDASPVTYPGAGVFWNGYVSSAGTVTVVVGAAIALTPAASNYNIRVTQ